MRKELDYYKTPTFATKALLMNLDIDVGSSIIDCCSGNGEITNVIESIGYKVITNDIDKKKPADTHFDAAKEWEQDYDFVITNPPYSQAVEIVKRAHKHSRVGMAMLLRLSFLEPTFDRQDFLSVLPPNKLIVLPRISFTMNGNTDQVTVAWLVWIHKEDKQEIRVVRKN